MFSAIETKSRKQQQPNHLNTKPPDLHLNIYLPAVWGHWGIHFICGDTKK